MCLRTNRREEGFTLIEVIISLVLLGIMGGMVLVGMADSIQVYRAALKQTAELPQADATHSFIIETLRHAESASAVKSFSLQDGNLSFGRTLLLAGVNAFTIHQVDGNGNDVRDLLTEDAAISTESSTCYRYHVRMDVQLSGGRTITYDSIVSPETGVFHKHWGKESFL